MRFFPSLEFGGQLHQRGIRSVGSHATLDTLLTPESLCRVRIPVAPKIHPFAWWPTPRWNVVLSEGDASNPAYISKELRVLKRFLHGGVGAILSGNGIAVANDWEVVLKGNTGKPIYARRSYGKGRLVLFASSELFRFDQEDKNDVAKKSDFSADTISWAAAGSSPVGGEPRMPAPMWGGGGIYQESEERLDGIVCYYSKNQTNDLLTTLREDLPAITADLHDWFPSPKPEEPMYLILCSGSGGGWAVNIYLPKGTGTISTSLEGIRSIFGHEQAHTMPGPCGAVANHPFGGNQGEEHAGWLQG